ncbi:MAG: hypothetical protein M3T49_08555 [Candidatus Eremiobacteraeota bacterium]|nr:hypothetical protein [Candidatus Eremiobacteraeota bacterium]
MVRLARPASTSALAIVAALLVAAAAPVPLSEDASGSWQIILQGDSISYSMMTLTRSGSTLRGTWPYARKTTYAVLGTQRGSKISLQVTTGADGDARVVGRIDSDMDGPADMVGTITLGGVETPFQGTQHSRIAALPNPIPPTPFGSIP